MIIEIKGVQFVNKGAELMLHAILEQLNIHLPGAEVALPVTALSPYESRARLGALQKFSLRFGFIELNWITKFFPLSFKKLSRRFGIIYECDVDVVLDASGFAYGDQWTDEAVVRMAKEVSRFKSNGAKYIFLPQAFGPFTKKKTIKHLRAKLVSAELIFARENDSYEYLMGVNKHLTTVHVAPDFTNLVVGHAPMRPVKDGRIIIIPNNNMISVRNGNQSAGVNTYMHLLVGLGEAALKRGERLYILNHEGLGDQAICETLSRNLGGIEIINETDPLAVKYILGRAKAVVSSRFHGCVSALSQGTPCLGTSWSHKYERLYDDYNVKEWLIINNECDYESLVESVVANRATQHDIVNVSEELKIKSRDMWVKVFEAIQ